MGSEIRKNRVFGNFKKSIAKRKAKPDKKKSRPGNSQDHLALVRQLPCLKCLELPCGEVHHLKFGTGERGMGQRSTDRWGVPLCHEHHMEVERAGTKNETKWFAHIGVDALDFANNLWHATGSLPRMLAVFKAHRLPGFK